MGPLAGIKIIEIAGIGPGPYCGMMLADMGADALDEHVGPVGQGLAGGPLGRVLEVGRDRVPPAAQQHLAVGGRQPARPVDADDVGAEVGQQHAGERRRRQPGELEHPHARKGSAAHPPSPSACHL